MKKVLFTAIATLFNTHLFAKNINDGEYNFTTNKFAEIICPPNEDCSPFPPPTIPPTPDNCSYSQGMDPSVSFHERYSNSMTGTKIEIGGEKHSLSENDFTKLYNEVEKYCVGYPVEIIHQLVGYEIDIPIYGDVGQELFFDISGRSSVNMMLSTTCGTYQAGDSGNKFVISTNSITKGTCTSLNVKLNFNPYVYSIFNKQPPSFNLNIMITEIQ